MKRRFALCATVIALVVSTPALSQSAEEYPNRPVELVVASGAGSSTDVLARILADALEKQAGQPFVVVNQPGASGLVAVNYLRSSAPDGYVLMVHHPGISSYQTVRTNPEFDVRTDVQPIGMIVTATVGLFARNGLPFDSVAGLVEYAKAHPGELTYGAAGYGSAANLATEAVKVEAGIDILMVPYSGASAGTLAALANGEVDIVMNDVGTFLPLATAGEIQTLAMMGPRRHKDLPHVPTLAETGVPGLSSLGAPIWFGLFTAAGTPEPIVTRLAGLLDAALADPDTVEQYVAVGYDASSLGGTSSPEAFEKFLLDDVANNERIVREAGIPMLD